MALYRGPGRPRKYYNARNIHINVKLNAKEYDMLCDLKEDLSMNTPEVIRHLLHDYYCGHYYGKEYRPIE